MEFENISRENKSAQKNDSLYNIEVFCENRIEKAKQSFLEQNPIIKDFIENGTMELIVCESGNGNIYITAAFI